MTNLIASEAGDDRPNKSNRAQDTYETHDHTGRRKRGEIPSIEDCLAVLKSLAGAVALGLLTPPQAKTIHACYAEILRHHQHHQSHSDRKGVADADVVELLRKDPKIFSVLEPFLTDDQIDLVMKNAKEGDRGQA